MNAPPGGELHAQAADQPSIDSSPEINSIVVPVEAWAIIAFIICAFLNAIWLLSVSFR